MSKEKKVEIKEPVSVSKLISFIRKNYLYNVWDNGVFLIAKMFKKNRWGDLLDNIYIIYEEDSYEGLKVEFLNFELRYYNNRYGYYSDIFKVGKKSDGFYIINHGVGNQLCFQWDKDISSYEKKKILNMVDFPKIFEYCNNMHNCFNQKKYWKNRYSSVCAYYNTNDEQIKIPICFYLEGVYLGEFGHGRGYVVKRGKPYVFNCNERSDINDLIEVLNASDPAFLDNLVVEFSDLPVYIQEHLHDDSLEEYVDERNNIKMVLKRRFKRKNR